MSKIKILSENLANKIAAGEVIERPASVVKEFIENAIDANARHIAVQVEGAGTKLIRVIDDGDGMDQDDVLLCLERHATSKLTTEEQLEAISTLGFRGEAIPSIASVSRLTIISRPRGAALGTKADVRFGKVMKVHESGGNHGTTMEVRELFGNVPARKKFLKSATTELFHIEEAVKNYALAFPDLGFTYTVNRRDAISWPSTADTGSARAKRVFGLDKSFLLIPIEESSLKGDGPEGVEIQGYMLPPDQSTTSSRLRLFVNGRVVKDRMINSAVTEGLQNFLMKGRRAAGVLFLTVDPTSIDVNVHPTKQEIRFRNPGKIHQLIVLAVRRAMQQYQKDLKFSVFGAPKSGGFVEKTVSHSEPSSDAARYKIENTAAKIQVGEPTPLFRDGTPPRRSPSSIPAGKPADGAGRCRREQIVRISSVATQKTSLTGAAQSNAFDQASDVEKSSPEPAGRAFVPIGQFLNSYILCGHGDDLVVIDQHAAHERLLFEDLKQQFFEQGIPSQSLMFPKIIEGTADEINILKAHGEEIARLGLKVQEFGGNSYVIKGIPALMAKVPPDEILAGIFEQFAGSGNGVSTARRVENILATMACKAAIKAGYALQPEEIEQLTAKMQKAGIFSHCPHGRPVVKSFSADDVKRWFHRT